MALAHKSPKSQPAKALPNAPTAAKRKRNGGAARARAPPRKKRGADKGLRDLSQNGYGEDSLRLRHGIPRRICEAHRQIQNQREETWDARREAIVELQPSLLPGLRLLRGSLRVLHHRDVMGGNPKQPLLACLCECYRSQLLRVIRRMSEGVHEGSVHERRFLVTIDV
jgi:hypothetical protein